MAALLALHGERPVSPEGLTKALLNHEARYWRRLLVSFGGNEPERPAAKLLALATLAGGFATPKEARRYWVDAFGETLSNANVADLFHALAPLYPGRQGLQPVRPDLLGEALVAQELLRSEATDLLDAVFGHSATQTVRRHALTVLARLSTRRPELHETLVEALVGHFAHCAKEVVDLATETTGQLPKLAEIAFERLSPAIKNQLVGLLRPMLREDSVQLAALKCLVTGYVIKRWRQRQSNKALNVTDLASYAQALGSHAVALANVGSDDDALQCARESLDTFKKLVTIDRRRYDPDYATALNNYANRSGEMGQSEAALEHAKQALVISERLAKNRPARFEDERFRHACFTYFLSWLTGQPMIGCTLPNPQSIPETIRPHRRSVLKFYAAFLRSCLASNEASRAELFKEVLSDWVVLLLADRMNAREFWLCATAWCAMYAPKLVEQVNWQTEWRSFTAQRHGRIPHWMLEVARRLSFKWPN